MRGDKISTTDAQNIVALDAIGQADIVSWGDLSPTDLINAAISQIEAFDGIIGALVFKRFEAARLESMAPFKKSGFPGVPILLKDNLATIQKGLPHFSGNKVLKRTPFIAQSDSPIGIALRDAGFVTLGITKVPELCWWTTTQPVAFGPTKNPWNLNYSVGGSSGGSAAAVASRMVPVATGTENAGSIRIPASFCGIVGFKPTRGLVPLPEPHIYHRLHAFALCRSIRDAAAILDVTATGSPRSLYLQPPTQSYAAALRMNLPRLRIGIARKSSGVEAHPDCQSALESVIPVLEKLGCTVIDQVSPALTDYDPDPDRLLSRCGALASLRHLEKLIGRDLQDGDVEPFLLYLANRKQAEPTANQYMGILNKRRAWASEILESWDEFDIIMSPTVCEPPVTLASRQSESPEQTAQTERRQMAFALPANETGQPAISLPLYWNNSGLPVGIQFVGDIGYDAILLRLAAHLEELLPWIDRQPRLTLR